MSWIGRIALDRSRLHKSSPERRVRIDPALFQGTLIDAKVTARFGGALRSSLPDLHAIADTMTRFEPFRAAQFEHALARFYGFVARQLESSAGPERTKLASIAVSTMRELVAAIGPVPELMPAIATLATMIEPRGDASVPAKTHAKNAKQAILDLIDRLEGREGASSMLHLHRHLVEQIEWSVKNLDTTNRYRVWQDAADLILEVLPRSKVDFAKTGHIAALFGDALREHPNDHRAAFACTKERALRDIEETFAPTRELLNGLSTPLGRALLRVLDQNPAGPAELAASVAQLAEKAQPHGAETLVDLTHTIELVADAADVGPLLEQLLIQFPNAPRVEHRKDVPLALLAGLIDLSANPDVARALEEMNQDEAHALRSALVLLPHIYHGPALVALASELPAVARSIPRIEDLRRFAERFIEAQSTLPSYVGVESAPRLAVALAKTDVKVDAQSASRLGVLYNAISKALPDVDTDRLFDAMVELLPLADFQHDPLRAAYELVADIGAAPLEPDQKAACTRAAIKVAANIGKFDRDPYAIDFPKVRSDWQVALQNPDALHFASTPMTAVKLRSAKSIPSLLESHSKLPPEVAVTASLNLSDDNMSWLMARIANTRSRAEVRVLRDMLFGLVALNRLDVVDLLAPASSHVVMGCAELIAQYHRQGKLPELPIDRIAKDLERGEDPAETIANERASAAMASLQIAGLESGIDPATGRPLPGAELLGTLAKEVRGLLTFLAPGESQHSVDAAVFRDPLLVGLKSIALGTWPKPKFESESADRQLAGLSDKARQIWREDWVTTEAPTTGRDDLDYAMHLVRGLKEALPAEWTSERLEQCTAEQKKKIASLHHSKHGGRAHRTAMRDLVPLTKRIAMMELKLAIDGALARGEDGASTLLAIKPFVARAIGPAKTLGGEELANVLRTIQSASTPLHGSGRSGVHAVDESALDAYLTSFGGSCVNPCDGFNRAGLVELIMSAQYKMGRVMDGDRTIGRTIFRLLRVKLPNGYEGHALRMDPVVSPTNWCLVPTPEYLKLMYRHGLSKAVAMGVPFMISDTQHAAEYAKELGCETLLDATVKVSIDKGHTGLHHNQGMNQTDYFIGWSGMTSGQNVVRPERAQDLTVEREYPMTVILPPRAS